MSIKTLTAIAATVISLGTLVAVGFGSYVSAANYGNKVETQLQGIVENNQNIYAQGTQRVLEIAQVPAMYKDDLKELVKADIEGRYGQGGSKATMQWIKERNLNLPETMYTKIQQEVAGFRMDFQNNQTKLVDVKASYKTQLGSVWSGMWLSFAGYPKIDLDKYKPIITARTEQVFQAGKEEAPLKLR
jgi:hypothetical protein